MYAGYAEPSKASQRQFSVKKMYPQALYFTFTDRVSEDA